MGGLGAAVIAFRAARMTAATQAASAHNQWLRQIRRDTYAEFLAAVDPSGSTWRRVVSALHGQDNTAIPAEVDELLGRIDVDRVLESNARVGLEAPDLLARLADVATYDMRGALKLWQAPLRGELTFDMKVQIVRERAEVLEDRLRSFKTEAKRSLTEGQ
ncbi:hypothetical protein ACFC5Z_33410 [Streptomyces sp. NPDC056004]|uniref:hypothetical protein n=1 Tax=Streptomyces sp. NPDC056004 TaxID=3345677 RepID=UPI0035D6688D